MLCSGTFEKFPYQNAEIMILMGGIGLRIPIKSQSIMTLRTGRAIGRPRQRFSRASRSLGLARDRGVFLKHPDTPGNIDYHRFRRACAGGRCRAATSARCSAAQREKETRAHGPRATEPVPSAAQKCPSAGNNNFNRHPAGQTALRLSLSRTALSRSRVHSRDVEDMRAYGRRPAGPRALA